MIDFNDALGHAIERLSPSDLLTALDRSRPYNGQPWTDSGIRGKTEVNGLTMRDLRDCYIRGCYDSSGLAPKDYPKTIFGLNWENIDPMAVFQNMSCWIERYMGIFPNIPPLKENFTEEELFKDIPIIEVNLDTGQVKPDGEDNGGIS